MTGVWPWLAVAGAGALHGLNPASGWALMAAPGERAGAWRALAPVAIGHAASVAAIVALAALGLIAQRGVLPWFAGGLAVLAATVHLTGHLPQSLHAVAGQAGVALWSLTMGVAHGTGLMLLPAFVPLCLSASPGREITASGSLALALAAVAVHLSALLAVAGAMAALARRGWRLVAAAPRRTRSGSGSGIASSARAVLAAIRVSARTRRCQTPLVAASRKQCGG